MERCTLIAAIDSTGGIAKNNKLPWRNTPYGIADMEHFRSTVSTGILLMGSTTFVAMGGRTYGRRAVVISSATSLLDMNFRAVDLEYSDHKCTVYRYNEITIVPDIPNALLYIDEIQDHYINQYTPIYFCGGKRIYEEAPKYCRKAIITRMPGDYDCDLRIPKFENWILTDEKTIAVGEDTPLRVSFLKNSNRGEDEYLHLIKKLMKQPLRPNRTIQPTRSLFAEQLRFPLRQNGVDILPLLTTKRVPFKAVMHELAWFISGKCTNTDFLRERGVKIWDDNTTSEFHALRGLDYVPGETGPIYGYQWRNWNKPYTSAKNSCISELSPEHRHASPDTKVVNTCDASNAMNTPSVSPDSVTLDKSSDQLYNVIETLRRDPYDRRMIVSAWNPGQLSEMVLPPCHWSFQFYVSQRGLHCLLNMRSADICLGVPFNIASYALLTHVVAKIVGIPAAELVISMADTHIYNDHLSGAAEQVKRIPTAYPLLKLHGPRTIVGNESREDWSDISKSLDHVSKSDFATILDYHPKKSIPFKMAI